MTLPGILGVVLKRFDCDQWSSGRVADMATTIEEAFREFADILTTPSGETSAAAGHRASIKQCLEDQFGMTHFFQSGSFGFGTNIPGYSDVDRFAVIPASNIRPNSTAVLRQVAMALRRRFRSTRTALDAPAIRIDFRDGSEATEIIPAIDITPYGSDYRVFKIPNGAGGWTASSPESHKQFIADSDEKCDFKLKPFIRFVKAWKYYRKVPIRSFYLELSVAEYALSQSVLYYPFHVPGVFGYLWQKKIGPTEDPMGSLSACQSAQRSNALMKLNGAKALSQRAAIADLERQVKRAFVLWNRFYANRYPSFGG